MDIDHIHACNALNRCVERAYEQGGYSSQQLLQTHIHSGQSRAAEVAPGGLDSFQLLWLIDIDRIQSSSALNRCAELAHEQGGYSS